MASSPMARLFPMLVLATQVLPAMAFYDYFGSISSKGKSVLVILLCMLFVVLIWTFWDRFIFLLTGDDRIHFDFWRCSYWCCCECCGLQHGNWFSCCCCCPESIRQVNVTRAVGRKLGLFSYNVRIRNIAVGDLPFDGYGDFYIECEYGSNPPMVTSVVLDSAPDCIHWPETLTLNLKNNPLAPTVVFRVKRMKFAGSEDVCELFLSPMNLLDWADDEDDRLLRFAMRQCGADKTRMRAPWICMEIGQDVLVPTESVGYVTVTDDGRSAISHMHTAEGLVIGSELTTTAYQYEMQDFKDEFMLVDATGQAMDEPSEGDVSSLRFWTKSISYSFRVAVFCILAAEIAWWTFYVYMWSCHRKNKYLLIANKLGHHFPVSTNTLYRVIKNCTSIVDIETEGASGQHPCLPKADEVQEFCKNPPAKQTPKAFKQMLYAYTGWQVEGVSCDKQFCDWWDRYSGTWLLMAVACIALFLIAICLRWILQSRLRLWFRNQHKEHARNMTQMKKDKTRMTKQSQWYSYTGVPQTDGETAH